MCVYCTSAVVVYEVFSQGNMSIKFSSFSSVQVDVTGKTRRHLSFYLVVGPNSVSVFIKRHLTGVKQHKDQKVLCIYLPQVNLNEK